MSFITFLHSDWPTKKKKFFKWWHRNDWAKAHSPGLRTRIKTEWYYITHRTECLVVDGWLLKFYNAKEQYMNWGDDINVYLMEKLTNKTIIPAETLLFKKIHRKYAIIGSVLPTCLHWNTIVWGSGCQNFMIETLKSSRCCKNKIKAVRGPLTRKFLIENRISCPEVYGDPALLLPIVYQPKSKRKKYPITIIPHHRDWDKEDELSECIHRYIPNVHIINMTSYIHWTDVIDEICQSDIVLSSSLHGLIVSDAYGIPNQFVEFVFHHPRYDKYEDYYASVKRSFVKPFRLEDGINDGTIAIILSNYKRPAIDLKPLIEACPFEINL